MPERKLRPGRQEVTHLSQVEPGHLWRYEWIAAQLPVGSKVLDAACGCGYGTHVLFATGKTIAVGIDISGRAIDIAMNHFSATQWVQADLQTLRLDENIFDVIVSLETLEHLPSPELALCTFKRALRPNGVLFASVPNEDVYPFDLKSFEGDEYPHQRHYTPAEFLALLDAQEVEMFTQRGKPAPVVPGDDGRFLIAKVTKW